MNYKKALELQKQICDQFFFNRKNTEVLAGDYYEDDPEPAELVFEIFNEVIAVNVVKSSEAEYAVELMSSNHDLYLTPILEYFEVKKGEILSAFSEPFVVQAKKRPLEIGCSLGHRMETWRGTLGCFVKDIDSGDRYVLSNHHVLFSPSGDKDNFIVQPSKYDGGKSEDAIGQYIRSLAPDPSGVNTFDAAVAGPISTEIRYEVPTVGKPIQGVKAAAIGMKIYKLGATTGKTFGVIHSIDSAMKVNLPDGTVLDYEDQIMIRGTQEDFITPANFTKGGDSGAVVLEFKTNVAIGLHFCGNDGLVSFSNKLNNLLPNLRISF